MRLFICNLIAEEKYQHEYISLCSYLRVPRPLNPFHIIKIKSSQNKYLARISWSHLSHAFAPCLPDDLYAVYSPHSDQRNSSAPLERIPAAQIASIRLELVGEERGDLVVVGVDGAQCLGMVLIQPLEELLREERVARLARVEAIGGLCAKEIVAIERLINEMV